MAIEINCNCCNCDSQTCRNIVKVCNIIAGSMLISLGILRFVYISQANTFLDIILSIYYILFGIIITLSEFGVNYIIKYFSFQEGYVGRGLFINFIGVLCFNNIKFSTMVGKLNFAFGICILFFGVLSIIYGFNSHSEDDGNPQSAVAQPAENYQDIRKV